MGMKEVWTFRDEALARVDLQGFELRARDGTIGKVVDSIEGRDGGYLVVDPGVAMPLGRRLLVPAGLVDKVDVGDSWVSVSADRKQVRSAPEFDPTRPLDEPSRSRFGDYFGSLSQKVTRPARRRTATRSRRASPPRARPAARSRDSRSRSPAAAEPTRAQLYTQAKKLDIEGRSKMNKAELARAVGRRGGKPSGRRSSSAKANPVEVQAFLERVGYPTGKRQLLRAAESQRATQKVRATLKRLPDKRFKSPTEVSEAIGTLS
jgi:hypothetical protein